MSRLLQSGISSLLAGRSPLPVIGTFVIHVLSMHPIALPKCPAPRASLVQSPQLRSCLSCACVLSCCPASRRRQEGLNSLRACLSARAQTSCYLSPASHPHSLLFCPDAAVTAALRLPASNRTAACAQQLHPPARHESPLRPVTSTPALSSTTLKTVQSPSARKAQRH